MRRGALRQLVAAPRRRRRPPERQPTSSVTCTVRARRCHSSGLVLGACGGAGEPPHASTHAPGAAPPPHAAVTHGRGAPRHIGRAISRGHAFLVGAQSHTNSHCGPARQYGQIRPQTCSLAPHCVPLASPWASVVAHTLDPPTAHRDIGKPHIYTPPQSWRAGCAAQCSRIATITRVGRRLVEW